jgi:hypothetical protein
VEFFEEASRSALLNENIQSLLAQAKQRELNDWGLICLLKTAAEELFQDQNEQTLFIWFGMLRFGYNIKTGYDNSKVYLLAPCGQDLYNTVYFTIKGKRYFALKLDGQDVAMGSINAYEADYPGNEKELSLLITKLPDIGKDKSERRIFYREDLSFEVDQSMVDFFSTYPECDLIVSLTTPLSETSLASLDKIILPSIKSLNDTKKVEYLMKFIQYGFPYKSDIDQFGKENYLFPDETLFYPYSDCEDRAALFMRLVEHYTNFKAIALCYPDHVAAAVNLPRETIGTYIDYKNERYFVCDPTYIGADIGMSMPKFKDVRPDIIAF